ncbi:hypothetical protein BJ508DRAFT_378347 [Ascobolus immersus RN42]|uniref:F-box domain-containing protein n=1 Tax=Ascobolus immersus RN42 TaxID=1160509 RepID=A0A3N4HWU1_ASCIM|nr:hypothetical protein BJ508DRAFT_378347 [Ascobolus immersus RN42]
MRNISILSLPPPLRSQIYRQCTPSTRQRLSQTSSQLRLEIRTNPTILYAPLPPKPPEPKTLATLPPELRLMVYDFCSTFTLLLLSHTSRFFNNDINHPRMLRSIRRREDTTALQHQHRAKRRPTDKGSGRLTLYNIYFLRSFEEAILFDRLYVKGARMGLEMMVPGHMLQEACMRHEPKSFLYFVDGGGACGERWVVRCKGKCLDVGMVKGSRIRIRDSESVDRAREDRRTSWENGGGRRRGSAVVLPAGEGRRRTMVFVLATARLPCNPFCGLSLCRLCVTAAPIGLVTVSSYHLILDAFAKLKARSVIWHDSTWMSLNVLVFCGLTRASDVAEKEVWYGLACLKKYLISGFSDIPVSYVLEKWTANLLYICWKLPDGSIALPFACSPMKWRTSCVREGGTLLTCLARSRGSISADRTGMKTFAFQILAYVDAWLSVSTS